MIQQKLKALHQLIDVRGDAKELHKMMRERLLSANRTGGLDLVSETIDYWMGLIRRGET